MSERRVKSTVEILATSVACSAAAANATAAVPLLLSFYHPAIGRLDDESQLVVKAALQLLHRMPPTLPMPLLPSLCFSLAAFQPLAGLRMRASWWSKQRCSCCTACCSKASSSRH
jgi:hypothetical protein